MLIRIAGGIKNGSYSKVINIAVKDKKLWRTMTVHVQKGHIACEK